MNTEAIEYDSGVEVIGEFMLEGEHVIARAPIDARQQQAESSGRVRDESDIRRRAVDEPADFGANSIGVVVPGKEIGAGQFIPMRKVARHGFGRAAGKLAKRRGVEIGPMGESRKLTPDCVPVRFGHPF